MTISCLPTETSFDVQCPVCGAGFLLLSPPTLLPQSGTLRRAARKALALHHAERDTALWRVHPERLFEVEGWDGEPERTWGVNAAA